MEEIVEKDEEDIEHIKVIEEKKSGDVFKEVKEMHEMHSKDYSGDNFVLISFFRY